MNKYAIVIIICLSFLAGCANFEKTIEKIATSPRSLESNQPRDKDQIKKSVVKITSQGRQGTGFIVGLVSDTAYILTVSHVVASDPAPNIAFFGQPREFKAEILEIEGQQENGFALLTVTGSIPSDTIPLYVANKFDLEQGDSVFTFGFPRSGGNWAYDDLSYSSRIAREILFSGSDMKEGNSGSPLIKGDEVVGMVTSVTDFAHANSSAGIREFLQGAKGGSVVLEQMGKWGINWRETYDKHLKETSMLAEQQRIAAEKAAKEAEDKRKQQLVEQERIAAEKVENLCEQRGGVSCLKRLGFGTFGLFDEGSAQVVISNGLLQIKNALLDLEENASILITGHADDYEINNYNKNLPMLRAAAVRRWLEDNGVRKGAIQIRGEVIHLPSSATDVHRRQNRHVEFTRIYE